VDASGRVFWSLVILVMVVLAAALPLAVRHRFEGMLIPSASMAPTLLAGDYVLVDKATHWPVRGDLVVFTDPGDAGELLVKRVVGLEGETLTVQGHDVFINCAPADGCHPLAEPYADWSDENRGAQDVGPVEVPAGAVFVMADNRNAGEDSRHWGPLSRVRIVGRPTWVYWSAGADGNTRWARIGLRLR
jgi:signal peptidase I